MLFAPLALVLCPTAVSIQDPGPAPTPYVSLAKEDIPAPQSALVGAGWVLAITEELVGEGHVTGAFWPGKMLATKPRKPEEAPPERREAEIIVDRIDALYLPARAQDDVDTVRVELSLVIHAANAVAATETYEVLMERLEDSPAFHAQKQGPTFELETRRGIRCEISVALDLAKWTAMALDIASDDQRISQSLLRRVGLQPEYAIGAVDLMVGERMLRRDITDRFVNIRPARQNNGLPAQTPPAYAQALEAEGLVVTGFQMKPIGRRTGSDWAMDLRVTKRSVE